MKIMSAVICRPALVFYFHDGPDDPAPALQSFGESTSVLVEILGRHVVFRKLPGANFGDIRLGRIFNTLDYICFEGLPFLGEFFYALRICFCVGGKALIVAGLARGVRPRFFPLVMYLHAAIRARRRPTALIGVETPIRTGARSDGVCSSTGVRLLQSDCHYLNDVSLI